MKIFTKNHKENGKKIMFTGPKFEKIDLSGKRSGKVVYITKENAFDYSLNLSTDIIITLAYLNIAVDSNTMELKYVWGISPIESWMDYRLKIPETVKMNIRLSENYEPGCSYRLDNKMPWKSYYDKNSGWYCIGNPYWENGYDCIEFANDSAAIMHNGCLKSIWLKPEFI